MVELECPVVFGAVKGSGSRKEFSHCLHSYLTFFNSHASGFGPADRGFPDARRISDAVGGPSAVGLVGAFPRDDSFLWSHFHKPLDVVVNLVEPRVLVRVSCSEDGPKGLWTVVV